MHSREAPGDPGAGPSGRTCQAAAHTVPHCGIGAEPTHRLWEYTDQALWVLQCPGRGGRKGLAFQPPPSLMSALYAGWVCEQTDSALGVPAPHSHIHEAGTPGLGGWCAEVGGGVSVSACTWANFSKKAENIYRFEVETQTGKAL